MDFETTEEGPVLTPVAAREAPRSGRVAKQREVANKACCQHSPNFISTVNVCNQYFLNVTDVIWDMDEDELNTMRWYMVG